MSLVSSDEPAPKPKSFAYLPESDSPYHRLDLYLPGEKPSRAPLLVYVHGGAWISGSRAEAEPLARLLAPRGFAVASLDYRLSAGRGQPGNGIVHPAHARDCAAGLAWLFREAARLGLDGERVYVMGHSAGAHLTALVGLNSDLFPEAARLKGLIGTEGIYDLEGLERAFPDYSSWFLDSAFGGGPGKHARWRHASPVALPIRHRTPWLLVQSRDDELVDEGQTLRFADKLTRAGARVTLTRLAGKRHDEVIPALSAGDAAGSALLRFLGL